MIPRRHYVNVVKATLSRHADQNAFSEPCVVSEIIDDTKEALDVFRVSSAIPRSEIQNPSN